MDNLVTTKNLTKCIEEMAIKDEEEKIALKELDELDKAKEKDYDILYLEYCHIDKEKLNKEELNKEELDKVREKRKNVGKEGVKDSGIDTSLLP